MEGGIRAPGRTVTRAPGGSPASVNRPQSRYHYASRMHFTARDGTGNGALMSQEDSQTDGDDLVLPPQAVLIVDDTPQNLVALEVVLEDLPCELVTAASGTEALNKLLKQEFALVLLDVQMPNMDGFEVAEIMRSNNRTANVPIIFVTANSREERNVQKGYKAGAVDFLFKPIDPTALRSKVSFFLTLDQQKRRLEAKIRASKESEKAFLAAYGQKKTAND